MTPHHVISAGNILGEGIQWHRDSGLWWTDIEASLILRQPIDTDTVERIAAPERVGSFASVEGEADTLLCAFETGFGWFDLTTGEVEWIDRPEPRGGGRRFNDGRVDRQGRFWAGTMIEDETLAPPRSAALYRLDGTQARRCHEGITISNGLAWSPDGLTMYFADSPARRILAFDFEPSNGEISNPRLFAETLPGAYPDGATVDADGCLWSAHWGASQVVRYRPDGTIDSKIALPVSQPSCVAFGGDALDLLFVNTARVGLTPEQLALEPLAGDVLVYRVGATGLAQETVRRDRSGG
ncbi:MAG: SMP-30/gluconolactonase/LRE family protein [Erythrobacter sp.]|nr:SMP-30/gluconolactonase/LRE family protein [Erythrobacter sp.]